VHGGGTFAKFPLTESWAQMWTLRPVDIPDEGHKRVSASAELGRFSDARSD
jgi:hypothetical protein